MDVFEISIVPATVARFLSIVAVLLVLASTVGQLSRFLLGHDHLGGLVPLFYLDEEENIPSFFSVSLMLIAAASLAVITTLHRKRRDPDALYWTVLTCGFVLMAYDEAFQVHEQLIVPIRRLLGGNHFGIFHYAWIIPGTALVIVLGLFFLKFLWRLPVRTRMRFLIAGGVYLGGAVGMEALDGLYADHMGEDNLTYAMLTTVEESLEMAGLIAFIWALLSYCADNFGAVRFRFMDQRTK